MVGDQDQDALVINLAGRQRMLVQQMTSLALQIRSDPTQAGYRQTLQEAKAIFDQTLSALIAGGDTPYLPGQTASLPPTGSSVIREELRTLQQRWVLFQAELRVIETAAPASVSLDSALQSLQALSPQLIQQADRIVRLYEEESERKLTRLKWIQVGFFLCAVGLLIVGVVIVRRAIIAPLHVLKNAAKQIGDGDLSTPIQIASPAEFADLAAGVDRMRAQLKISADDLEARVHQRTRELTAFYDVIREISSHLAIERVLDSVTSKARDVLTSDVAFLCLLDDTGESLTLKAHAGPQEAACGHCVLARHTLASEILGRNDAMICEIGGCQTIAPRYRASHLAAPLRVGERTIGALCVGSTQTAMYSQEQVRLLTELANSAAIALENARLYAQAEQVAALEERQRIAADMHDSLAQTLSYIKLKTGRLAELIAAHDAEEALRELDLISAAVESAGQEVRRSIASLRAMVAPERTLQEHITECVMTFADTAPGVAVAVAPGDDQGVILPPDDLTQVLRIVQEALHNACRHARATRVTVRSIRQGPQHQLVVEDDGCGFDPAQANGTGHFGLSIMQARAARIRGKLVLDSAPGRGTRVILTWPVQEIGPA